MVNFTVIIPARYESSRLPGKPLADIGGKTMIERVYYQASLSGASKVVVATDDERIKTTCERFGGEACMTSSEHLSGTDRIYEVCQSLTCSDDHIVVNVQGDEPLIPPAVINQVANNLYNHPEAACATLSTQLITHDEFMDANAVND